MKSSNEYISINRFILSILIIAILVLSTSTESFGQTANKSITLNWTAPGDDGTSGTATTYDIRYSTSLLTDINWNSATQVANEPLPSNAGSQESFVIDSLEPSVTYYIAIKASDEASNWSAMSNVISKTTASESIAPSAIASLAVSNPTDSSALITWTAPGDDGNVGQATLYEVRYSISPITLNNWSSATVVSNPPSPSTAGTTESFTINGLSQEVTYYIAVRSADEVPNWSDLSNVVSTTTLDITPPSTILDLSAVTGEDNGTIVLGWTAPGDDNMLGTSALFEIRYSLSEITDLNWQESSLLMTPPSPLPAGEFQSIQLTGLTPGQMYYTGIKAYDSSGNSSAISNYASAEAAFNLATDIDDTDNNLPTVFSLDQNYPNPFNPSTTIGFSLPTSSFVDITIYNVEGKKVKTLVEQKLSAGNHSIEWDGTNGNGSHVATGVYVYRIATETYSSTKKMVLIK